MPLAGRTILQMDQTASSYQAILWHLRERSQDANMDCYHGLRLGRHREKAAQYRRFALHNSTNPEPNSFRKNNA